MRVHRMVFTSITVLTATALITSIVISNKSNEIQMTPATIMSDYEIITNTESESSSVKEVCSFDVMTKDGIRELMLNSTDYFNTVSGEFLYTINNNASDLFILSLECDIDASTAKTDVMQVYPTNLQDVKNGLDPIYNEAEIPWARTQIADGTEWILKNSLTGEIINRGDVVTRDQLIHDPIEKRFYINPDGTSSSVMRADPTNTYFARRILTPEELTFSLLCSSDEWDITGTEEYAGRNCVVITGIAPDFYTEKNDVVSFVIYVDKETGILLKYVGLNAEQEIVKFTYTKRIAIS